MASDIDYRRDHAFSYALYGIQTPPKDDHVLLRVQHWSSSADRTERKVGNAANTLHEEEDITSAKHEEDLGLWVGLRPARGGVLRQHDPEPVGDDTETQTALAEIKGRIKKTKNMTSRSVDSLSELSALPIWPLEADMTRVVVKYNTKRADKKLTYFELVNRDPVTKLCVARTVNAADCFFFHAYRNDSVSTYGGRAKGWGHVIRDYMTAGMNVPLDVTAMINRFAVAAEEWMLDEIARAITETDEEIRSATVPQVIAIYRLLDINATFKEADAQEAHLWMTNMFPNLMATGTLTSQILLKYAADLRRSQTFQTYSDLRDGLGVYLLEVVLCAGSQPIAGSIVNTWEERSAIRRLFTDENALPPSSHIREAPEDLRSWLRNHLELVDFMVDIHGNIPVAVMQRYGAAVYNANVVQLLGNISQPARDEPAKHLIIQAVQYAAKEIMAKCNGVITKMEPYMEELKSAIKSLVEEQSDDEDMMEED